MLKGRTYNGEIAVLGQKTLFILPKRPRGETSNPDGQQESGWESCGEATIIS